MDTLRLSGLSKRTTLTGDHIIPVDLDTGDTEAIRYADLAAQILGGHTIGGGASGDIVDTTSEQELKSKVIGPTNTITGLTDTAIASSAGIDASKLGDGSVSSSELACLSGVTEKIKDSLDRLTTIAAVQQVTVSLAFATASGVTTKDYAEADIKALLGWSGIEQSIRFPVGVQLWLEDSAGGGSATYSEATAPTKKQTSATSGSSVVHLDKIQLSGLTATKPYLLTVSGITQIKA